MHNAKGKVEHLEKFKFNWKRVIYQNFITSRSRWQSKTWKVLETGRGAWKDGDTSVGVDPLRGSGRVTVGR
jgi:hypothetical protein